MKYMKVIENMYVIKVSIVLHIYDIACTILKNSALGFGEIVPSYYIRTFIQLFPV